MIDPELHAFLADWDKEWSVLPADAAPKQRREHFETIAERMRAPTPDVVDTEVRHVPFDGRGVRVRIFRHRDETHQACLVYMHGGAWSQGSPETHWDITAGIAAANRQTVISIDYALAPEHPFPAALDECKAVVEWVFDKATELDIRPDSIAIGGDSAGANLAAALTLVFRGSRYRICGQLLIYPAVDFEMTRPSYAENANGPIIVVAGMEAVRSMYCPDPQELTNPLVAPLRAADHSGLPPAFIATAEHDPLRDDGRAYAERLEESGVAVESHLGSGLIHGYLRAMKYCEASRSAFDLMCAWLRRIYNEIDAAV